MMQQTCNQETSTHAVNIIPPSEKSLCIVMDSIGTILEISDECCRLLQYSAQQVVNSPYTVLLADEDKSKVEQLFLEIQKGNNFPATTKHQLKSRDGRLHFVEWSNTIIQCPITGKISHLIAKGFVIQETKRKPLEFEKLMFDFTLNMEPKKKERVLRACINCRNGMS